MRSVFLYPASKQIFSEAPVLCFETQLRWSIAPNQSLSKVLSFNGRTWRASPSLGALSTVHHSSLHFWRASYAGTSYIATGHRWLLTTTMPLLPLFIPLHLIRGFPRSLAWNLVAMTSSVLDRVLETVHVRLQTKHDRANLKVDRSQRLV